MPFITLIEIIDIAIMTFAIGFIFSTFIKRPQHDDILKQYQRGRFNWEDIKFSAMVAAPAVVLHELAHKFIALGFGAEATLHAPYFWYGLVILMRLINFPLVFFVGGYVSIANPQLLTNLQHSLIAVAGPLMNLLLFTAATILVKYRLVRKKYFFPLLIMGRLNLFLFIFNMIPLPGFDGYWVFRGLLGAFG